MEEDFDKQFFQKAWGPDGYVEPFSYGVGIDAVCDVGLYPFMSMDKNVLEIGSGGGTFTQRIINQCKHLIAIDVIRRPKIFNDYENFTYVELDDRDFDCPIGPNCIDFAFCYNVFCHLSNDALCRYLKGVNKALVKGGDFVFMLSDYEWTSRFCDKKYELGDHLPMGHFYQDLRTLDIIVGEGWEIVNNNMIPDHRDLMVHLRKI